MWLTEHLPELMWYRSALEARGYGVHDDHMLVLRGPECPSCMWQLSSASVSNSERLEEWHGA